MHWRRNWQPTPVFLPGEAQGRGSLVGCRLWGRTESDTTEATQQQQQQLLVSGLPRWLGSIHLARQEMQEAGLQPLGQEDALEEGMATCSSVLVWRIP